MSIHRSDWSHHIDQVVRSRHYSWIAENLDGAPLEHALVNIATDIMHICQRQGISWDAVLEQSRMQFEEEEQGNLAASAI